MVDKLCEQRHCRERRAQRFKVLEANCAAKACQESHVKPGKNNSIPEPARIFFSTRGSGRFVENEGCFWNFLSHNQDHLESRRRYGDAAEGIKSVPQEERSTLDNIEANADRNV